MISVVRRNVDEVCAPLGCYAALNDNSVATFRDNLWVPSSSLDFLTLEDGAGRFPETSVHSYHSTLCNIPEQRRYRTEIFSRGSEIFVLDIDNERGGHNG